MAWLLLLLVALVAGVILFFSSAYARGSAADLLRGELVDALGREVTLDGVDFHLWTWDPTFEIRGLVIPGPHPGDPAVLRLGLARLRLSWRALARRRLDIEQIDVDRPDFYLRYNPDGTSNLPHVRHGKSGEPQRLQLSLERVVVTNGTFQLNERRVNVDVDARAVFVSATEAPSSSPAAPAAVSDPSPAPVRDAPLALDFLATAQDVAVHLPNAHPYAMTLSARGRVDGGQMRIAGARLAGPDLSMQVNGGISWAADNQVDLAVKARVASRWVNRVGYLDEPIDGPTEIDGRFVYRRDSWEYSGLLHATRIGVLHREFRDLLADFRGGSKQLDVQVRHVQYAQGTITGPVVVLTGAAPGPHGGRPVDLDLGIRAMALQPFLVDLFPEQFAGKEPPVVLLAGLASGRLRYRFQSSQWRLGTGEAQLRVEAASGALPGSRGLPLAGDVPLRMAGGVLSGGTIQVSAPGQEATITGFTFDLVKSSGRLDYRLASHDTGALAPLFPPIAPARKPTAHWAGPLETSPIWLPNAGHGTATGTVTIRPVGYSALFDLDLADVVDHSLGDADRLHGTLTVEPQAVENLRLEATAADGALMISGRIPLAPPGRTVPEQPIDLAIDASLWPAAGLLPYLPAWFPVAGLQGVASGRVDLGGNFERLTGQADAELEGLVVSGVALGRAVGRMSWDPEHVAIADGVIEDAAGKLLVHGSYDRLKDGLDFTLDAPALDIAAQPLAGLLHTPQLSGRVALMAALGGTFDRPTARLSLRAKGLAYAGHRLAGLAGGPAPTPGAGASPPAAAGALVPTAVGATPTTAAVPAGEAQLVANWDGELVTIQGALGSLVSFDGGGRLTLRQAALRLDLRSNDLGGVLRLALPLPPAPSSPAIEPSSAKGVAAKLAAGPQTGNPAGLAALPGADGLSGSLAGALSLDADFSAGTYHGELRLDELRLGYAGKQIANREPVVVDLSPERLAVRSFYMSEAGTELEAYLTGTVGLTAPMPLDLRFTSTVSTSWAKLVMPSLDISGAVDVLATVRGTVAAPELSGQAVLHDARLVMPGFSTLEGVEGTVLLYRDRLVLDGLTGRIGGGTVRAQGQLALPGNGRTVSYRLDLTAQGVSLRYPEGWVTRGDATLSLVGSGASRQVQGVVRLTRALYVENLQVDLLQLLLRGLQRQRVQVAATNDLLSGTQLNLAIQGPGALRVTNNVADLRGDVNLTVVGSLGTPVVFGSVKLEQGGTLEYSDNKYQVDRGTLTFANPNRVDPIIDVSLKTEVQSYTITLNLSGTLERLSAKFASNADLADIDILSLLAAGSRPEIGAPPPPGPQSDAAGQAAASQFLAGQATSALSSRVGRLFGLDRFRVDTQTLTQAGEPTSGVVITAGKRLSKNIFITYVSNPSSPRLDVRQIEWQVARNVTVLLTQSGSSYAVDVQRETRF
jgi:hypothetical protein